MNVYALGMGCCFFSACTRAVGDGTTLESRIQMWRRLEIECIRCISGAVMQSLGLGHGYLLRLSGNLVQGTRLYAINGFCNFPLFHQQHSCYFSSHLSLRCTRQIMKAFGSDWRSPESHRDRRPAAGHSLDDITKRPRHGSYPYSHIANRPRPDAMSSIFIRDTQKKRSHVVVIVACAPNASSWPLHSRHDTPVTW